MDSKVVIKKLGFPNRINDKAKMVSKKWECVKCKRIHEFSEEVRPPAPCFCGGIGFKKID